MTQPLTMDSIQSDIESLSNKIEQLEGRLKELRDQRTALEVVVKFYSEKPKKRSRRKSDLGISPTELKGMELEPALIFISERNEGQLNSTAARKLLESAEVLSGTQGRNILWSTLRSSPRFENVGRGSYVLIDSEEVAPTNMPRLSPVT